MISRRMTLVVLTLIMMFSSLFSQVAISPTSAFLDNKQRFETILIMNNSKDPQEVKLAFKFAYPKANEAGDIELIYEDTNEEKLHSATDWLRGFPKNFVLGPGERQIVRVTAKPPRGIEPGMYWSRLVTTSSAVSAEVGAVNQTGISTQITMQFNQITSIFYKSGEVSSGVLPYKLRPMIDDQVANIFVDYTKSGNAPFLGTMHAEVFDGAGKLVQEKKVFVSVYYDGLRRLTMDISDLAVGDYDVVLTVTSGRSDIPANEIVPSEPQTIRGSFTKI
ncbi:MAG: hypothetical protein HQ556_07580 [Candidatus Marinimicrobia bacterium]|nr:hypothetical protein [Candidatus Neomarinimicrobiota bacterium]